MAQANNNSKYQRTPLTQAEKNASQMEIETADQFPLTSKNFLWMAICGAVIVLGFLLMLGGASTETFNPDIFSTRRIVVGPTIAFLGFVGMAIAIIYRPKAR